MADVNFSDVNNSKASVSYLLNQRRGLLVDPDKNQGALAVNWRKIQRAAPSSRGEISRLPHWERRALESSLASNTPQDFDHVIGKAAVKQSASDALKNIWGGASASGAKSLWDDFGPGNTRGQNADSLNDIDEDLDQYADNTKNQPDMKTDNSDQHWADTDEDNHPADIEPESGEDVDPETGPEAQDTKGKKEPKLGEAVPEAESAASTGAKAAAGAGDAAAASGGGAAAAGAAGGTVTPIAAAGAGAAAPEAAALGAAAFATPEFLLFIIGIVVILLALMWPFFMKYPEKAAATEIDGTPSVICIDPGHKSEVGSGTSGGGETELHMNWVVATELKDALEEKGYTVAMTKNSETEYVTNIDRVDRCAKAGAALDYRIHMDQPGGIKGPWHEYPGSSYTNITADSKSYAEKIQKSIVKELDISGHASGAQPLDGGTRPDTKALVGSKEANKKKIPAVLIEMMTMDDNPVAWIKDDTNRSKLVKGMANGIADSIPVTTGVAGGADSVMTLAKEQIGKPYVWGGCRPVSGHKELCGSIGPEGRTYADYSDNGTDCSGFVTWAWYWGSNKKIKLPAQTKSMYDTMKGDPSHFKEIKNESDLLPGDIILFTRDGNRSGIHHTALFESNGKRLHAWYTGSNIKITSMGSEHKFMFRPINY